MLVGEIKVPEGVEIIQVIVVHRHGDRAPISRSAGTRLVCDPATWAGRVPDTAEQASWDANSLQRVDVIEQLLQGRRDGRDDKQDGERHRALGFCEELRVALAAF